MMKKLASRVALTLSVGAFAADSAGALELLVAGNPVQAIPDSAVILAASTASTSTHIIAVVNSMTGDEVGGAVAPDYVRMFEQVEVPCRPWLLGSVARFTRGGPPAAQLTSNSFVLGDVITVAEHTRYQGRG